MGTKLKQAILEEVVKPHTDKFIDTVKANVVIYDGITNRASIIFPNPQQPGDIQLFNVPVQIGSGGVHSAGPFPGDLVWVNFAHGDIKRPKIVALADEDYENETREKRTKHEKKGVYIPDFACQRSGW